VIEEIVFNYLKQKLSVPVYLEIPENAPDEFVVIEKTGSSRTGHLTESTLAIQSIAESMYQAMLLNEEVKMAMDAFAEKEEITKSALNSDYNFTDTRMSRYRYQAVYDVTHY
jgi:hypothetical protein